MLEREILWAVIVVTIVLAMFVVRMLLDEWAAIKHQRRARKEYWEWIWYTRQR